MTTPQARDRRRRPVRILTARRAAPSRFQTLTRIIGAMALLVVGGVHYQQYQYEFYSAIPTIGPLFLANAVGGTALGLFLLSPVRPLRGLGGLPHVVAALAGIGLAAGAFIALMISEHTPLFGFQEHGYRFAIVLALASEALAIVMLTLFLWRGLRRDTPRTSLRDHTIGTRGRHSDSAAPPPPDHRRCPDPTRSRSRASR
jgi:hypothetical protein